MRVPKNIEDVASALRAEYLDFDHFNLADPIDELLFIICSQKTTEITYRDTFRKLRASFPTNHSLYRASEQELVAVFKRSGLAYRKAKAIRLVISRIVQDVGLPTLDLFKAVSNSELEAYLVSLPGVGKKIARCVMLYSFGRQVFPTDSHCWRIARRLGWVRPTRRDKRCSPRDMDRIQAKIPSELRFSLHVNMVSHGRKVCLARKPLCSRCVILQYCRRVGVRESG